jgi:hypothetical protein
MNNFFRLLSATVRRDECPLRRINNLMLRPNPIALCLAWSGEITGVAASLPERPHRVCTCDCGAL